MKQRFILYILCLCISIPLISQDTDLEKYLRRSEGVKFPNVIKINALAIPYSNISLTYERALAPRLSFNIGAGYKYSGEIPKLFTITNEQLVLNMDQITGYSITPELRYYLKACNPRLLEGFYVGLYFRHTHYETEAAFEFYTEAGPAESYKAHAALNEYGAGLSLGYQLMLWERLSIDFLFIGPRFSTNHIGYEFDQKVSQEFLEELSNHINGVINRFEIDYEVDVKQSGEGRASTTFSFTNMRFGISLGFAF